MRLSKSKINTYLKCPLEFRLQYIEEIEAEPNEYMVLGSDVHSVAETFADRFGDELDKIDIKNELLKISNDLDMGPDVESHVDNLEVFFREVFVDNDYKLFSKSSTTRPAILASSQDTALSCAITSFLSRMSMRKTFQRWEYSLPKTDD